MKANTVNLAQKALKTEVFASAIYRYLALRETDNSSRQSFSQIAEMEYSHVNFWHTFLQSRGISNIRLKPDNLRLKMYWVMLRSIGRGLTLRLMETSENQAIELYSGLAEDNDLTENEKKALSDNLADELIHENTLVNAESKFENVTAYIKDAVAGHFLF